MILRYRSPPRAWTSSLRPDWGPTPLQRLSLLIITPCSSERIGLAGRHPDCGAGFSVRQEVDDLIYGRVAPHRGCVLRLDGSVIDPAGGLEVVRTGRPPLHEPVGDHTQAGLRRDGLLGGVREELVPPPGLALGGGLKPIAGEIRRISAFGSPKREGQYDRTRRNGGEA